MIRYEACPSCGCDGVRPYAPLQHVGWQRLDGRCRRCGVHPAEHEVVQLARRVETLEKALALAAWHAVVYDSDNRPVCTGCRAADTEHDNCPVMGAVERLECPFPEEGIDPLAPVVDALSEPTYVSRLTEDVPSRTRPGHVHRAGTEFAPVRSHDRLRWEIEIRVPEDDGFWHETMVVDIRKTEVVLVPPEPES